MSDLTFKQQRLRKMSEDEFQSLLSLGEVERGARVTAMVRVAADA